jgi:hypothetical protein
MPFFVVAAGAGQDDGKQIPPPRMGEEQVRLETTKANGIAKSDRQISFEVRRITASAQHWRDKFESRLKLVSDENETLAWVADHNTFVDLIEQTQADVHSYVFQAPKMTAFEFAHASMSGGRTLHYVARLERPEGTHAFRPVIKTVDDGWKVKVSGSFRDDGVRMSSDIVSSSVLGFDTLKRTMMNGDQVISGTIQIPNRVERRFLNTTDIRDDWSLIVSLGLKFNKDGGKQVLNLGRRLVGMEAVDANTDPIEELVVITPRRIRLGPDGRLGFLSGDAKAGQVHEIGNCRFCGWCEAIGS